MVRYVAPLALALLLGCDEAKPPSAPVVGELPDAAKSAGEEQQADAAAENAPPAEDFRPPIAANLLEFVPKTLDGVAARNRTAMKSSPIAAASYKGKDRAVYNVKIVGPKSSESERRSKYPLLGKEGETSQDGGIEAKGLKVGEFDAERLYDKKKKLSEVVVLVNPFVLVDVNVAPTDDPDHATKLLEEIDLKGASLLR